jgi:hypothetical protein
LTRSDARLSWWGHSTLLFRDGCTVRTVRRPITRRHVFVADNEGRCLYAAYAGGSEMASVDLALQEIKRDFAAQLI